MRAAPSPRSTSTSRRSRRCSPPCSRTPPSAPVSTSSRSSATPTTRSRRSSRAAAAPTRWSPRRGVCGCSPSPCSTIRRSGTPSPTASARCASGSPSAASTSQERGVYRSDVDPEQMAWMWLGITFAMGYRRAVEDDVPFDRIADLARMFVRTLRVAPAEEALVIEDHPNRKWWTLFAMCFALFMIMLDNTVVNVALPSIQRALRTTPENLEWTINAYVLTFAGLILLGGKLGDRFGRKRLFLVGLAVFTASSAACALSSDRHAADRLARRAGRRRGVPEPAVALDPGLGIPAQAAAHRHRHLGRHLRPRPGDRPAARRLPGPERLVVGRVLDQRPDRHRCLRGHHLGGHRVARPVGEAHRHRRHRCSSPAACSPSPGG